MENSTTPVSKETEIKISEVPVELAFGVVKTTNNLLAVRIVMYKGNKVLDKRTGEGTTMGHAIGEAEDLIAHWNLNVLNETPEEYFRTVRTI